MEPFGVLIGRAAVIELGIVDTDQIIPARFLKHPRGPDYRRFLFHDHRFGSDGAPRPGFPLDEAGTAVRILVSTGPFGTGSAREGAVWALAEYGIRAVVAPAFGDVFRGNAVRNGILPVLLEPPAPATLAAALHAGAAELTVDLPRQELTLGETRFGFPIDVFEKEMLAVGLDEIGLTARHEAALAAVEAKLDQGALRLPLLKDSLQSQVR